MPTNRYIPSRLTPRYPKRTEAEFKREAKKYATLSSAVVLAYMRRALKDISKDKPITAEEMAAILSAVAKLNNKLEAENNGSLSFLRLHKNIEKYAVTEQQLSLKI